jgi:mycofactocin precursor
MDDQPENTSETAESAEGDTFVTVATKDTDLEDVLVEDVSIDGMCGVY